MRGKEGKGRERVASPGDIEQIHHPLEVHRLIVLVKPIIQRVTHQEMQRAVFYHPRELGQLRHEPGQPRVKIVYNTGHISS